MGGEGDNTMPNSLEAGQTNGEAWEIGSEKREGSQGEELWPRASRGLCCPVSRCEGVMGPLELVSSKQPCTHGKFPSLFPQLSSQRVY